MRQLSRAVADIDELKDFIIDDDISVLVEQSHASVILIYAGDNAEHQLPAYSSLLAEQFPGTPVVGCSTSGEIDNGDTVVYATTVTFMLFDHTEIETVMVNCPEGEEHAVGEAFRNKLDALNPKAVIMINTPLSFDSSQFSRAFSKTPVNYHIIGGGAGDYAMSRNLVMLNDVISDNAILAIALIGDELEVIKETFIGWRPMSKEMTITDASGCEVRTINDEPAFNVYRQYLNIHDDEDFFANALGFPMLVGKGNTMLARVPVKVTPGDGLHFISDFEDITHFQLGFIDPTTIKDQVEEVTTRFRGFKPDGIMLFSCGCRRFAMMDDIQKETRPFAEIAPTSGFYTIGEICDINGEDLVMRNLSFVAVGFREGPNSRQEFQDKESTSEEQQDKYRTSPTTVIQRLLHFIDNLNSELESKNAKLSEQNEKLLNLSVTDSLTGIFNRKRLDDVLTDEFHRALRMDYVYSIILLDLDDFKMVNDEHGHQAGDRVLVEIAGLLTEHTRRTDIVGRWVVRNL